ncbi:NAD(P)H-hydrate epimerase [Tenacibaculum amylolyticum]|uniref:NAD(P)H-hydrate epimerase n=1 Tax=Tenacibaculum amylolyticum TaxID=104269 RepID=UPI0038962B02
MQEIKYPEIKLHKGKALELSDFRDMDYYAVNQYELPIELMMENAGLHLASVVTSKTDLSKTIKIGVGNGNNGGGGLVAARRLASWGYKVYIDAFTEITRELPLLQLKRALKFGVSLENISNPDVWIDAYLGFSQRLPLKEALETRIIKANESDCLQISLDIPTGFLGDIKVKYFKADTILSLAAPKKITFNLPDKVELLVADLGIPHTVYKTFGVEILPFHTGRIIKIDRS